MKRCLLCVGVLCALAAFMGADYQPSPLQIQMAELLDSAFGMKRVANPDLGEEYSFVVTETAIEAMKNLKESQLPLVIANTDELAIKKSEVLKAMGFIQREFTANNQEVFKLDVEDVTMKTLRGKTVNILADGTVKFKETR